MLGSKTCYYTILWQLEGWPGCSDPPVPALTGKSDIDGPGRQ